MASLVWMTGEEDWEKNEDPVSTLGAEPLFSKKEEPLFELLAADCFASATLLILFFYRQSTLINSFTQGSLMMLIFQGR